LSRARHETSDGILQRPLNARCLALATLVIASTGLASASVELRHCDGLDGSALESLLALELHTLGLPPGEVAIVVTCAGALATIRLAHAASRTSAAEVRVDLSRTAPQARARLVALAASELVARTERAPQRHQPATTAAGATPTSARGEAPARANEDSTLIRPLLLAGVSVERAGKPATALAGVLLGTQLTLMRGVSLPFEARYAEGSTQTSVAGVDWQLFTASAGLALDLGAEPVSLTIGPSLRAGWVTLEASATPPNQGRRLTGPWLAATAGARGWLRLSSAWRGFAGLEGGCLMAPVRGTLDRQATLVEAGGCYFGGSLGLGYAL